MLSFLKAFIRVQNTEKQSIISRVHNGVYRRLKKRRERRSRSSQSSSVEIIASTATEDRYCASYEHRNTLRA